MDELFAARQISVYRVKLLALEDQYRAGNRFVVAAEAQHCADALLDNLQMAPPGLRTSIDSLIDRFDRLRANCSG